MKSENEYDEIFKKYLSDKFIKTQANLTEKDLERLISSIEEVLTEKREKKSKVYLVEQITEEENYSIDEFINKTLVTSLKNTISTNSFTEFIKRINKLYENRTTIEKQHIINLLQEEEVIYQSKIDKALDTIKKLVNKDISFYRKKKLVHSIATSFLKKVSDILIKERKNVEIQNFGTFNLKSHQRFGSTYIKFELSSDLKKKLKKSSEIEVEYIEEYLKQKDLIDKVLEDRKKSSK